MRIIDIAHQVVARCSIVFGFCPPIIRPEPTPSEISQELNYRVDKLQATGFVLQGDFAEEIDATLKFCRKVFEEER